MDALRRVWMDTRPDGLMLQTLAPVLSTIDIAVYKLAHCKPQVLLKYPSDWHSWAQVIGGAAWEDSLQTNP